MFWYIFFVISAAKLLLIPSYRSTDFEVHRNWLAITHSLPISKWYYEETSEWTLDYPPLFAWFEYLLSHLAKFFDPEMLKIQNLNYASQNTILFQRLSVIVMDVVYALGAKECCQYLIQSKVRKSSKWTSKWQSPTTVLQILLLANSGLIMVDHIHFQYNGFLLGILLLSIAKILQGNCLQGAIYFTVLLNFKHIFLYIAPSFFVYLLRNFCFTDLNPGALVNFRSFVKQNFLKLVLIVTFIFIITYGPFCYHIPQILSRLFPFHRGLTHAYWAPNFWAIYNSLDKVLELIYKRLGYNVTSSTATSGLVEELSHAVLPTISPRITFFMTAASMTPALFKLWSCPGNPLHFLRCLILSAFCSFIFGYHVHEKAILICIIPLTVLAVVWQKEAQIYLVLAITGSYSIFPLLFTKFEIPIKVILLLIHSLYSFQSFAFLFDEKKDSKNVRLPLLSLTESFYILGYIPLFIIDVILFPLLGINNKLPFLNLLLTSLYCSIGIMYSFIKYYIHFLKMNEINYKRKAH